MADEYGPTPDALVALIRKAVTNEASGQTEMFPLVAAEKAAAALRAKRDVVLRALGGEKVIVVSDKPHNCWQFPVEPY